MRTVERTQYLCTHSCQAHYTRILVFNVTFNLQWYLLDEKMRRMKGAAVNSEGAQKTAMSRLAHCPNTSHITAHIHTPTFNGNVIILRQQQWMNFAAWRKSATRKAEHFSRVLETISIVFCLSNRNELRELQLNGTTLNTITFSQSGICIFIRRLFNLPKKKRIILPCWWPKSNGRIRTFSETAPDFLLFRFNEQRKAV